MALGLAGCGDQGSTAPGYASKDNLAKIDSGALSGEEITPAVYQAARKAGSARMAMTMKGQGAMKAQGDVSYAGGGSTMQMTMSKWGKTVKVRRPAAADLVQMPRA